MAHNPKDPGPPEPVDPLLPPTPEEEEEAAALADWLRAGAGDAPGAPDVAQAVGILRVARAVEPTPERLESAWSASRPARPWRGFGQLAVRWWPAAAAGVALAAVATVALLPRAPRFDSPPPPSAALLAAQLGAAQGDDDAWRELLARSSERRSAWLAGMVGEEG